MSRTIAISACPLDCFGVCSFKVTCENGRVVALEPDDTHPTTGKLICSKGRSHIERMNDPERLLEPLRRTPTGWETISWDTALDHIAEKIRVCLATEGHHAIASYLGGGAAGKLKGAMDLFFRHLGGGTVFTGGLCWAAGIEAQTRDFGKVISHGPEDLLNARTLVFWGKNPADTHFHLMPWVTKARKNGCQVLLIDPVASATAGFADRVIRPLPGTDWALALAVIHRLRPLQSEGSESSTFFSALEPRLLELIDSLEPAQLLQQCDVSEAELQLLTEAYSLQTPCATYIGYGMQRYEHGGASVRLIDLLAYLAGQIGIPGGGASYANKVNSGLFDWSWAEPTVPPQARTFQQGNMGPQLANAADPPVKLMFIACANPAVQAPDSSAIAKGLQAVETVIVIDHFMTDTAALADYVLPATFFLEEEDVSTSGMWNSTLHYSPRLSEPRGHARSELWIFSELAKRLMLTEFPQLPETQWIERLLRPLAEKGIALEALQSQGWLPSPNQQTVPWQDQRFATADGTFTPIDAQTVEELIALLAAPVPAESLPLISFHRRDSINSQHRRGHDHTYPEIRLHPDTAQRFSLAQGELVRLSSGSGNIKVSIVLDHAVRPGVVAMKQGSWKYADQCLNVLTPSGVSDIGEMALLNAARVQIIKL